MARSAAMPRGVASPPKRTVPDDGAISPASIRSVVVLPAPLGPSSAKISPRPSSNDTRSTATRSPNVFVSVSAASIGGGRQRDGNS